MNDDFLTIYLKGLEDGKEKKKQEIKMLEDENKKYKEVLDKIKEYCNNRLQYYNEMKRDYDMQEFDGYFRIIGGNRMTKIQAIIFTIGAISVVLGSLCLALSIHNERLNRQMNKERGEK